MITVPSPSSPEALYPQQYARLSEGRAAGVVASQAQLTESYEARDPTRSVAVSFRAVAQLTEMVVPPAIGQPGRVYRTGITLASTDLFELQRARDRDGRQPRLGRAVSELTVEVVPPAIDQVIGGHTARVVVACAHAAKPRERLRGHAPVSGGLRWRRRPKLAKIVVSPAVRLAGGGHAASVERIPRRNRPEPRNTRCFERRCGFSGSVGDWTASRQPSPAIMRIVTRQRYMNSWVPLGRRNPRLNGNSLRRRHQADSSRLAAAGSPLLLVQCERFVAEAPAADRPRHAVLRHEGHEADRRESAVARAMERRGES